MVTPQDVISKWEGYVSDHEHYDTSYNSCHCWLADLRKRLANCSDMAGDLSERQHRLQVKLLTVNLA